MESPTPGKRRLIFLTSADGGLAHYAVHLWRPVSRFAEPHFVTYANRAVDEWVKKRIGAVETLLDPSDDRSVEAVVEFIRATSARWINFHVGTTAKRHAGYFVRLLSALRDLPEIRIISTLHDVLPFATFNMDMEPVRDLNALADGYVVGNRTQRDLLLKHFDVGSRPVAIAPHGPYTLFDNRRFDRTGAREHLGLPAGARIVLFFGRLRPDKGLDCLLEALPLVRRRVPEAMLFISTDTSYTPQWNEKFDRLASEGHGSNLRVQRQYVPCDEIEPIFKAADVLALPYENVSQSGVLNLAKAFKRPAVVTDIFDEASEIDHVHGRAVPVNDPVALADALVGLLSASDEERDALGARALRAARKNASWEISADALRGAFVRVSDARRGGSG